MKPYLPMRFYGTVLFVFLLCFSGLAQLTTRGTVLDVDENPLVNVKVEEKSTKNTVYTDDHGRFLLSYFADDSKITFSLDGYETLQRPLSNKDKVVVYLTPREGTNDYHLGFSVGYLDFKHKNRNKNLENMPYFLGESDVNRQLQMLPGIEQGNEGYSNLFVRGGEVDQNLMLYNGTPIYNSNHIFGISSVFHNRSINNTAVYRGIAPAKYGGRSSSVISLESKKTAKYSGELDGEFEITPLNMGLYIEKINKDKSYYTISARRSWIDLLIPLEQKQNSFNANIYDLQFNFGTVLKNKDKLDVSVMNTRDLYFQSISFTDSSTNQTNTYGFEQRWSNLLTSLKYTQYFGERMSAEHSLYYSGYSSGVKLDQERVDSNTVIREPSLTEQEISRGIRDIGVNSDWQFQINNMHNVSFGFQSSTKLYLTGRYDYSATNFPNQEDVHTTEGDTKYRAAKEFTLYGEDSYRFSSDFVLNFGLRNTLYAYDGFVINVVEPRLHATVFLKKSDALKFSYNRHNQFTNQLNIGRTGGPNNIWVPATENILPQSVNMLEAGYEKKLGKMYSASVNAYLKSMDNLIQVSDLNDAGDPGQDWQSSISQGIGTSTGVELFFQKSKGSITGWLSYAYSNSTRQFDDLFDDEFLFTFDRPHMLKVYMNYKSYASDWNFGFNYIVGSGQLFTLPIGKFRDIDGNTQLEYNTLNNYRSPVYQRIDLSFIRIKDTYDIGQEWRFYVYNTLRSRNPLFVSADFTDNSYTELTVNRSYLAFVPGVAYVVKF